MKRGTVLAAILGLVLSLGSGSALAQPPGADLNCDGCVDRSDLSILMGYRNQPADACEPSPCGGVCDLDGDGIITVLDARRLIITCSEPRCAPCPPPCTDNDGDEFNVEGGECGPIDCDDDDPDIYPGALEVCDGEDNNCNGAVDEGLGSTPTTCGTGACEAEGELACMGGEWVDSCTPGDPTPEECDGVDNDCNGTPDDGLPSDTITCGIGECLNEGLTECIDGEWVDNCTPLPSTDEVCDGLDNNCDGATDEGLGTTATTCGTGACEAEGELACIDGEWEDSCTPGTPTDEVCDNVDNNCDGSVDEGLFGDTVTCGVGECVNEDRLVCVEGEWEDNCTPLDPTSDEICDDELDNDCDGYVDDADADCLVATIEGHVTSQGVPVPGADVQIGLATVNTTTDGEGNFSAEVGPEELMDVGVGQAFPIEVNQDGYGAGYAKVAYFDGQTEYTVEVNLIPISDEISAEEDVTSGVTIEKGDETVGELTIPPDSLPPGVEQVFGSITYIDPTTTESDAFPGGDFLAVPEGEDPNDADSLVTLESLGLMEFDLVDEDGDPISDLAGPADVCMKVPDGLEATVGETIPLWYYDPDAGLWVEEGSGVVEDRGPDGLWICGQVSHFTWWNYDRPVATHACFKFQFVQKDPPHDPIVGLTWYAAGVDYSGTSPERPCECDGDDPDPPCPPGPISSFTVKKSESGSGSAIRVYTNLNGVRYYLHAEGNGTYTLTTDVNQATVFNNPAVQASCISNQDVDLCHFLDESDPYDPDPLMASVPANGNNGIMPLGDINLAPVILTLFVPDSMGPGTTEPFSAEIEDPEGDDFTVDWSASCPGGFFDNQNLTPGTPSVATADYTAPLDEGFCLIELTATDALGNVSVASQWVGIFEGGLTGTVGGTVYGPGGAPLVGATVYLEGGNYCEDEEYFEDSVTTNGSGEYFFPDVPCCYQCEDWFDPFFGQLIVEFQVNGTPWTYVNFDFMFDCCGYGFPELAFRSSDPLNQAASRLASLGAGFLLVEPAWAFREFGDTECTFDIFLPTFWGTVTGNAYDSDGEPSQIASTIWLYADGEGFGELQGQIPIGTNGEYSGAVPMISSYDPVHMSVYDGESDWFDNHVRVNERDQVIVADIGPGAVGSVVGTVFVDGVNPVPEGEQVLLQGTTVTTGPLGMYSFPELPVDYRKTPRWNTSPNVFYGYGMLNARGQTATIDINGRASMVQGTAYDVMGDPLPAGVEMGLYVYRAGGQPYHQERTFTDGAGQFQFSSYDGESGVPTGDGQLTILSGEWTQRHFEISEASSTVTVDIQQNPPFGYGEGVCGGEYFE